MANIQGRITRVNLAGDGSGDQRGPTFLQQVDGMLGLGGEGVEFRCLGIEILNDGGLLNQWLHSNSLTGNLAFIDRRDSAGIHDQREIKKWQNIEQEVGDCVFACGHSGILFPENVAAGAKKIAVILEEFFEACAGDIHKLDFHFLRGAAGLGRLANYLSKRIENALTLP